MSTDSLLPAGPLRHCRCGQPVPKGPLYDGWGSVCADRRGLVPHPVRLARPVRKLDGPNLLDLINEGAMTMRKIPTLFLRNSDGLRYVTREVHPDCKWVLDGEGAATRKYDGTCVMFDGDHWWARREVKPGKRAPTNYRPIETDPATGKTVGWEPIEQSAFVKFHAEAVTNAGAPGVPWPAATYELIGPKVNGNPEGCGKHLLVRHSTGPAPDGASAVAALVDAPRDYAGLVEFMRDYPHEGIVWHHPDGRMAKIKTKDFPAAESTS